MAGLVELPQRITAADDRAGREVRPGQVLHELVDGRLRIFQQADGGVDHLAEVVRRDVGRHADADAGGAVDQQLREAGGQHRRFRLRLVEVRNHVDGLFLDVAEHLLGEALHAALGIAAGRRRVAVDVAEVALPFDQRIAHREVLRQPDQRVVDRRVAVRMVLTHHFADHARALDGRMGFAQPELPHRVEDPAVHRLQTVANIRNRPADVDAQRILQICSMHNIFNIDRKIPVPQFTHNLFPPLFI